MSENTITRSLQQTGCTVTENEPMASHTTFKIGGEADWFVCAEQPDQAAKVLRFCHVNHIPLLTVGNGSNLLVSDKGIEGVVLRITANEVTVDGTRITAQAGASLTRVCLAACSSGLSGLEFAYGIPGTVGGAVYMNAGAYGGQLSDVVESVTVLDRNGETMELSAEQMEFGYRHSVLFEQPLLVWAVTFRLNEGVPVAIRETMEEHMTARKHKQPLEFPSGGSFFKRPEGQFAGALIEQCGLKGRTVGGAQISEKHAGFVINCGGATCADVMELCRQVQQEVQMTYGVTLEREVQLVGR